MDGSCGGSPTPLYWMKPVEALELLSRSIVDGQMTIAELRRNLAALPATTPEALLQEWRNKVDAQAASWSATVLPHLAVGLRMALEVLDTYGPEGVSVDADEFDAGVWENKYRVWLREFGGGLPE